MRIFSSAFFVSILSMLVMTGCSIPGMNKDSSADKQNTSTQSEVAQSGSTSSSDTQKCPVKPTDLGTPTGTGSGLVSTTGSQVKVEYALYDTCGTSIQGTRENRLAFDAVV